MSRVVVAEASPSLALLKYWGKRPGGVNVPATPSVAVNLGSLRTTTRVSASEDGRDHLFVGGMERGNERSERLFEAVRAETRTALHFHADSINSFPGSSGLASSSSGFAALACACARLAGAALPPERLSRIARLGSASAARAVIGGFAVLEAGGELARPLFPAEHWSALRIVVAVVTHAEKPISSGEAMERSRATSPYFRGWLRSGRASFRPALTALGGRDLAALGPLVRQSYLRMFSTMFTAEPPIMLWRPETVAILAACERLRAGGVQAWETMDAGPHVKILCLEDEETDVREAVKAAAPGVEIIASAAGGPPAVREETA